MPCGRTTKDRDFCCKRKHRWWNTYWTRLYWGTWTLRCLFCKTVLYTTTDKLTLKEYIFKTKVFGGKKL